MRDERGESQTFVDKLQGAGENLIEKLRDLNATTTSAEEATLRMYAIFTLQAEIFPDAPDPADGIYRQEDVEVVAHLVALKAAEMWLAEHPSSVPAGILASLGTSATLKARLEFLREIWPQIAPNLP